MRWTLVLTVWVGSLCAADWPQFLGPERTGVSAETGLLRAWPAGAPKMLWKFGLGVGFGGAAVEGGKAYVLDRVNHAQDVLRCLDLATGKEEWNVSWDVAGKHDFPGSRSTPAVDAKHVFAIGPFGDFYCVDKATRKPLWRQNIVKDHGGSVPNWGVSQSPLLYGDWVVVAPQSGSVGLMAVEKATGKAVWKSPGGIGEMSYASPLPVKIGASEQIVQLTFDGPTGVEARTGKPLWRFGFSGKWPIANPTYLGNGVFFVVNAYGSGCAAFQVTPNGTQPVFKHLLCETQIPTPVFHKGFIYTVGNNNKAREGLMCLSPDGKVVWKTGRTPNFERGNLLLADGMLFVMGGDDGMLYLVEASPQAYKELARAKVLEGAGKQVWGPIALADGHLLVRDQHELRCFDVKGR